MREFGRMLVAAIRKGKAAPPRARLFALNDLLGF
jgi:hypothetical protein